MERVWHLGITASSSWLWCNISLSGRNLCGGSNNGGQLKVENDLLYADTLVKGKKGEKENKNTQLLSSILGQATMLSVPFQNFQSEN